MCLGRRSSWYFWSVKIFIKLFIYIWILLISFKIKLWFKIWEIFLEYIFFRDLTIFSNIKLLFLFSNLFRSIFKNRVFIFIFILYIAHSIALILFWSVALLTHFPRGLNITKIILLVLFWVFNFFNIYF